MNNRVFSYSLLGAILFCVFVGLGMRGCYLGVAKLRQAEEWTRQIKAKAEKESDVYKKKADSIRAEGTAIANSIRSIVKELKDKKNLKK